VRLAILGKFQVSEFTSLCPSILETCQFLTLSPCDDRQQTGCETVKIRSSWSANPSIQLLTTWLALRMSCDKSNRPHFKEKWANFKMHTSCHSFCRNSHSLISSENMSTLACGILAYEVLSLIKIVGLEVYIVLHIVALDINTTNIY
jgi:hypothetical protein